MSQKSKGQMRNHLWPLLATNKRLQHLLNRNRSMCNAGCSSKASSLHLASCSGGAACSACTPFNRQAVLTLVFSTLTLSATLVVADLMCFGAGGKITSCTACEDGQSIVSGSSNGSVHLWRVEYVTRSGGMPDKYTGLQSMSLASVPAGTACTFSCVRSTCQYSSQRESSVLLSLIFQATCCCGVSKSIISQYLCSAYLDSDIKSIKYKLQPAPLRSGEESTSIFGRECRLETDGRGRWCCSGLADLGQSAADCYSA